MRIGLCCRVRKAQFVPRMASSCGKIWVTTVTDYRNNNTKIGGKIRVNMYSLGLN